MTSRRSKLTWLLGLVLFSAAGLLAFGLLGLQKTAQRAQDTARNQAVQAARDLASNLSRATRDPSILGRIAASRLFTLNDKGELEIPSELGWVDEPPLETRGAQPTWAAEQVVNSAQHQEFVEKNADAAIAALEAAAARLPSGSDRGFLLSRAAWTAHRAGSKEKLAALLDGFDKVSGPSHQDVGAVFRLRALANSEFTPECESWVLQLRADEAFAFCDRLKVLGEAKLRDLRERVTAASKQRRMLSHVKSQAALLSAAPEPTTRTAEGELIVFFPSDAGGKGAVVTPEILIEVLGFDRARFHIGNDMPGNAISALPRIAAVPSSVTEPGGFANSGLVTALLILLALTFCLGLFLTLKAVRREALAAQARTEFLTSVTHELKTPLASIRLLAEMLEDNLVTDEARKHEYFRLLSGESARLTMLIENVLDLGRMERGERAYDKRSCDLNEVVQEAVHLFAPIATRDGINVIPSVLNESSDAEVDRGAMVQVLLNLLENAKKYARDGEEIYLNASVDRGVYTLAIRDFGPGIPELEREAVFERFKRGAAQSDGRIAGVGLGLYLARRIMRDHGGELCCVAPPDDRGGACFEWKVPVRDPDAG